MSTAYAIAGVTAVLMDLIDNGLKAYDVDDALGGNVKVSAEAPDRIALDDTEQRQVNLFLYQVTPNPGWRNTGLPTRNSGGDRIGNAPLALDLHYLLTAYGQKDYYAEILLGHAMHLLHDSSVIPRPAIRKALAPSAPPPGFPAKLKEAELAEQVEQLKITPVTLTMDEMSKVWSALNAHYRPTTAYLVTVVLIEGKRSTTPSLPVLERRVGVRQLRQPVVRRILSAEGEAKPIEPTSTIVVEGESLAADAVSVRISGVDVPDAVTSVTDSEIRVDVAPAIAAGVRAGVQVLQVVHSRSLDEDDPQALRPLTESNAESFVLRPAISAPTPMGLDNGVTVKAGEIEVTFVPNVGVSQRVVLLLNELAPAGGAAPRAYSFAAPQGNGIVAPAVDTEKVRFPFKRVIPGTYLVRARVDGADSRLKIENEAFAKPTVTI